MVDEIDSVRSLEEARFLAMANNDAQTLADLSSNQLIYTHGTSRRDSRASLVEKIRLGVYRFQKIDADLEEIVIINDTACVVGKMSSEVIVAGKEKTLRNSFLSVWCRAGGEWKFVAYQPTPIIDPA